MARSETELIWQGRMHLGDGPGVYGDAAYVGLGVELPLTLRRFPDASGPPHAALLVETEGLKLRGGVPGPVISVVQYAPGGEPGYWRERVLTDGRLEEPVDTVSLDFGPEIAHKAALALGLRLRINTEAPPGLYADFVLVGVRIDSTTHYASLGFQSLA